MVIPGIVSAFLHEMGHITAAYFCKEKIKKINVGFASVDIVAAGKNHENSLAVLLSGSLANFTVALIFKVLYLYSGSKVIGVIMYQNLYIGIFNLLPISTLDGGQILFLLLNKKFNIFLSEKILTVISVIFLVPVCALAFLILIKSRYNFSLLILVCYLISYIFFKKDNF